jgi:cell wall-associated NlpC family hydrolase
VATRQQVIDEARSWVGTPFHHQGRIKGEWVDCAGVIAGVAHTTGLTDFDVTDYGTLPVPPQMERILDSVFDRVPMGEQKPGDIFWMKDRDRAGKPRHCGFSTERGTIIHADNQIGGCVEHRLDEAHRSAIVRWYRFRGLEDE